MLDYKFIITGDFHIGNVADSWMTKEMIPSKVAETFKQIDYIIDYAIKNKIKYIKIVGDIFHNNRPIPKYVRMFIERLNRLEENNIDTVIIKGNHEENNLNEDALAPLKKINYKNIMIIDDFASSAIPSKINYIYLPHITRNRFGENATDEMVSKEIKKQLKEMIKPKARNIVFGHIHESGAVTGAEQFLIKGGINFLDVKNIDIVEKFFFGHIHKYQKIRKGKVTYCGSVVRTDFGETNEDKGFVVYDLKTKKETFIKLNTTEYKNINVDLVNKDTINLNEDKIKKVVKDKIIKLKIKVAEQNKHKLNITEIVDSFSKHAYVARREILYVDAKNKIRKYDKKISNVELLKDFIKELNDIDKFKKKKLYSLGLNILSQIKDKAKNSISTMNNLKLEKIILKNFRCFDDLELDLKNINIAAVIGTYDNDPARSNGSGKTTLFTAILWIIYGHYKKLKTEQLIRIGENEIEGTLIFNSNGKRIVISRGKNKKSSEKINISINKNNISGKKEETQSIINDIIGIDYDLFTAISFFLEDNSDNFCKATPAVRKDYLRKLLKLEIWENALDLVKNKFNEKDNFVKELEIEISNLKEDLKAADIKGLKNRIEKTNKIIINKTEKYKIFKDKINEYDLIKSKSDSIRKLYKVLKNDVIELRGDVKKFENDKDHYIKDIKTYKIKLNNRKVIDLNKLKKQFEEVNNNTVKIKTKGELKKDNINILNNIKDSKCPTCSKPLKNTNNIIEQLENDLKNLRNQYKKLIENKGELKEEIKTIENENLKIENLKLTLENSEDELKYTQKQLEKRIIKLENKKNEFKKVEIQFNKLKRLNEDQYQKNKESYESLEDELSGLKITKGSLSSDLKKYNKNKLKYKNKIKDLDILKEEHNLLNILKYVFGKNGISAKIISDTLDEIENNANNILIDIDRGEKRISFKSQKENKAGKITDSLDIWIKDITEGIRKYETYSKGESVTINLSVRLALSYVLSERENVWQGLIVLDEVFGNLDSFNREQIINVINHLIKNFNQIFIMSHTEIKNAFKNFIWIEKKHNTNISRLKQIA